MDKSRAGDPSNVLYSQYRQVQSHAENTNDVPGTSGANPDYYASVNLDVGERSEDDVWEMLTSINSYFYAQQPAFGYALLQNSNSYANTLMWMMGLDTASYIAAATPQVILNSTVGDFPGSQHNLIVNNPSNPIVSFSLI